MGTAMGPAMGTGADTTARQTDSTSALEPFLIPLEGLAEVIRAVIEPMLDAQGFELVQLHVVRGHSRDSVRLFLDKKHGTGAIAIADLEETNRLVSDLLDVEDNARKLFSKPYDLEVGSPGLDRPLTKKSHFAQALGKKAKVKTRNPVTVGEQGARSLAGAIHSAGPDTFSMTVEGAEAPVAVRYDDITSAHVVFEFSSNDPRKSKAKNRKARA